MLKANFFRFNGWFHLIMVIGLIHVGVLGASESKGRILYELFSNVPGSAIKDIPLNRKPNKRIHLTKLEAASNFTDNYGARIRGFVYPPKSGNYTFWVAADDVAELWLSTDSSIKKKRKIAFVNGWTVARQWDKQPGQKSKPISLKAGKAYYIEVLHKEAIGGDNLSVGWQIPGGKMERPIPGKRLSSFGSTKGVVAIADSIHSLENIYSGYRPTFSAMNRTVKFSNQKHFFNMGTIAMDAQVSPIIKKANELAEKGRYRDATNLYRRILKDFSDELFPIAQEGIFIPAVLYVQRKIMAYPQKELNYYRILFDPAAKAIYERAVLRFSIPDYKDLVRFHLATSYGDDALFALGNAAMDNGSYNSALHYYKRIVTYHGKKDIDTDKIFLDRDQVWIRLATCYKHLGKDDDFNDALEEIKNKKDPIVARLLQQLALFKYDEYAVRQRENRRSARHNSLDDRRLTQPMPYEFPANQGEWQIPLAGRRWFYTPEARPWATETDLIYKDLNVLYSRSLLTGEINWVFGPGGSSRDWDFYVGGYPHVTTNYYPEQSILAHDGAVFAHMFVYGPSLAAVDQNTGRLLWAKGPMAASSADDWLDRFQASPAAGRGSIIAPIVHDDIRGRSHISSSADLAAYESRTGKLLWRTTLSRIAPLKITQSRYPRKIRIFSSTPLVKEGVVYHVTNAGVVGAVDAMTGDIRWLTRYPQTTRVLDNFSNPGGVWRNTPPMIRGNKIYVTPVDSGLLLCLDKETGRVLWSTTQKWDATWAKSDRRHLQFPWMSRMNGFAHDGSICLSGGDITFLDAHTGRHKWNTRMNGSGWLGGQRVPFGGHHGNSKKAPKGLECAIDGEGNDFWWNPGIVEIPPVITKDGRMYFTMRGRKNNTGGIFWSDYTMELKTKTITHQRRWFTPRGFIYDQQRMPPIAKRVVNEEPEAFRSGARMAFTRWDTAFEVNVYHGKIVVRYDRKKLNTILAKQTDLDSLFAKAEIARKKGEVKAAIKLYEACKPLLPSEEEDRRRNINLRLFPLYMELARWGHQSQDMALLEHACRNMGATASNPMQEIRTLMAYAEYHEKRGNFAAAVRVLQNASQHYWREPLRASGIEIGERDELASTIQVAFKNLVGEMPTPYAIASEQMSRGEQAAISDYFLSVANTDRDYVVETRSMIARKLRELLKRAPAEFRKTYEASAGSALNRYKDPEIGERLLWCWPEANASKTKLNELVSIKGNRNPVALRAQHWRLKDLAQAGGLGSALGTQGDKALLRDKLPILPSAAAFEQKEVKNSNPDMFRLALPQKGHVSQTSHLLFVGGRKRHAYGNRFTVSCWDLKNDKMVWDTRTILLRGQTSGGKGYEVGFEEIFIHENLAIVHGRFDVVALDWRAGKSMRDDGKKEKAWHFQVPLGLEIKSVKQSGEVLIVAGRGSTLALSAKTGQIIWASKEAGEFYAGPFLHKDVLLTVRTSPAEVSFRQIGSGRLLSRLRVPGLTNNRKHPIFQSESKNPGAAAAAEAYPVACAEGLLAISDGLAYHVIDIEKRHLRWSTRATKLDPSVESTYRFWINNGLLIVIKPYYSVLENVVFDLETGNRLWRRREGGKKQNEKLKKFKSHGSSAGGQAVTGLILSSMTFVNGIAYGVKYEMSASSITLVGMDPKNGNQVMKIVSKGFDEPEAYMEPSWSADCVTVRIQDGNKFELWQVNVKTKKIVQKLKLDGFGRMGEYGDASMIWQGPYMALWTFEKRKVTLPVK